MRLEVYEYSNKGGRDYNEDTVGHIMNKGCGVFVVADGLGGHSMGELASKCAVETILSKWDTENVDCIDQMSEVFEKANAAILDLQKRENTVMKSTAAVLAINKGKAVFANSGDSRVYYFHDNELNACTEDHSVAYKKYKAGEITRDMIGSDEDQSRLLRTLGGEDRYKPSVYVLKAPVSAGDAFLLCSDGLWEYLRDEEILIDLFKSESARHWAELLLVRVMERIPPDNDNLSVMTIRFF